RSNRIGRALAEPCDRGADAGGRDACGRLPRRKIAREVECDKVVPCAERAARGRKRAMPSAQVGPGRLADFRVCADEQEHGKKLTRWSGERRLKRQGLLP